jgi:hypothetical protein
MNDGVMVDSRLFNNNDLDLKALRNCVKVAAYEITSQDIKSMIDSLTEYGKHVLD